MTTSPDRTHGYEMFEAAGENLRAQDGRFVMDRIATAQALTLGAIYRELRHGHD